ncbi:MAG TPA: CDGSH iron-sulfur domain-containing protein [Gammaproteobacteria bacterium]|nr:CDGSH iron-sulfur domain-containing protein [Gammaproteobacteria bacterium]
MSQKPTIELKPNGPLLITNLEVLENSKGERLATETVIALCRCGGSASKPFCDGTHKKIGFSDERLAEESAGKKSAVKGVDAGEPAVTVTRNGPYEVVGAIALAGQAFAGTRYYLCRCGGSGNKPFCDGTHAEIGFEDGNN